MKKEEFIKSLSDSTFDAEFRKVYVTDEQIEKQKQRYIELYNYFCDEYNCDAVLLTQHFYGIHHFFSASRVKH